MLEKRVIDVPNHFEVTYRFLTPEEGGRMAQTLYQGYRSDWSYEGDDAVKDGIYMIWPVFLDSEREIIEIGKPVPSKGAARMFVVSEAALPIHKERIRVGTRGYFMEGPNRVATAEITRIVELKN